MVAITVGCVAAVGLAVLARIIAVLVRHAAQPPARTQRRPAPAATARSPGSSAPLGTVAGPGRVRQRRRAS